ncbi:putative FAD-dependent oxidoreductase IfcE [Ellagibacter isourolithinifaciens]|uniref:putative FAD-dependent oxidoreductase IfcE n=1 Tax=Ellagibacter isourolithinifaciens TaxID=2137581 RepID=UPI003A9297AC
MARLSVAPRAKDDAKFATFLDEYERRVEATPPGMCAVAMQLDLLRAGGCQTCGKCVPCREGIAHIETLLEEVLAFDAEPDVLEEIRAQATVVRDTADCAIGWHAAEVLLAGLDAFKEEFESHVKQGQCREGVAQTVPCETLCPAHVNVPAYIALAGSGDYAGAIGMIRKDNPFPTACAFVCEHPCENRCRRTLIDAPINIRGIKKFAVDQLAADKVPTPAPAAPTGKKIAIVGGGPSGLTCAYFCALMGHEVHVLEMRKQLGGMMRYGIPAYRFPRERLDEDIRAIVSAGNVTVHTECHIDAEGMRRLSEEYDAVYVAIGAQGGKTLKLDGADAEGVMSAVDLLTKIGDDEYPDFTGKNVVVVGGGNVAMDCARTSVRAGAASVTVAYRRRLEDMTALRAEIDSAMQEGVEMMTLQAPDHIEVENGQAVALYTQPQFIGPVKRGRPAPQKADKPLVRVPADVVLIAVGQDIESAPFEEAGMQAYRTYFEADDGLKSVGSLDNVFVGGDCQVGPKTVIIAIGAGKVAARNIDDYLGFNHELDCDVEVPPAAANWRQPCGRVNIVERPARERKGDFDAVEVEMSAEEAFQEARRCLRCDHFGCGVLDEGRVQYV